MAYWSSYFLLDRSDEAGAKQRSSNSTFGRLKSHTYLYLCGWEAAGWDWLLHEAGRLGHLLLLYRTRFNIDSGDRGQQFHEEEAGASKEPFGSEEHNPSHYCGEIARQASLDYCGTNVWKQGHPYPSLWTSNYCSNKLCVQASSFIHFYFLLFSSEPFDWLCNIFFIHFLCIDRIITHLRENEEDAQAGSTARERN